MSVVVSVEDVGPCRKQLKVEVPAPAVEAETQRVVREYGQKVKIPGFRKGKVPSELVRRRFAKDIDQEVKERLLPRYWRQAQAEASLDPLLPPEVQEVDEIQPGEPLTFLATVETRPEIELRNVKDFDLPDPDVEPTPPEVEEFLEGMRRQMGKWVPVERPASRGDLVSAELTETTEPAPAAEAAPEGAAPEGAEAEEKPVQAEPIQVEVGSPRVWEELSLALSGLAAGQEVTFTRHEPPVQHGDHEHPARDRSFRVRATSVQEREMPELTDEFARKVDPQFQGVDDLKEAVVRQIRSSKMDNRRETRQQALLDQLRERHPMELPQGVVRHEVERMVQDYAEDLSRRGVDVQNAPIEWNRIANDLLPLAERRVHARLLLDSVSDAEGVQVSEEEFERALASLARAQGASTPALRRSLDESGRLAALRSQLRRDKTIRHLLGELEGPATAEVTAATTSPEAEPREG
jgi:trigger factor